MRIQLRRGVAAIIGWITVNCIMQLRRAEFAKRFLHRPQLVKLSAFDESLLRILNQSLREGHTCLPLELLMTRAEAVLGASESSPEEILGALQRLQYHRRIHLTDTHVALTQCAVAEETIAQGLSRVGRRVRSINPDQLSQFLKSSVRSSGCNTTVGFT